MLTVPMVGATFRPVEARDIVKRLTIGDTVQLIADPNNEYDTTAVAVYSDDVHIGFIPKESNSALFAVLMDGAEITAEIIAFESTLKPVLEIHFDQMPGDEYDEFKPVSEEGDDHLTFEDEVQMLKLERGEE